MPCRPAPCRPVLTRAPPSTHDSMLKDKGCDVNHVNKDGQSALHWACEGPVRWLLQSCSRLCGTIRP